MALREFDGQLDAAPKLKEFTGNLDGQSPSAGAPLAAMGIDIMAALKPAPTSVLEGLQPNPAAFDFNTASRLSRKLDDNAQRQKDFGTIGPIVGPKPSASSIINGLFTDVVAGGKNARAGINQMAGDMAGSEYLQNQARKERGQADLMTAVNTPEFESDTARAVYGGLSSTARMVPSLAAAILTKNPEIALGGMVAPMVPDAYGKYRQRGATPGEALPAAVGEAGIEYFTEKMPMGFLVKNFGKIGATKMITGFIARDALPEQVATLTQDAIDTAVANPDKTWGEYMAERPGAAYQTLVATGTQAALMGGANAAMNRLSRSQAPTQSTEPTAADYQAAVQKIFGTGQAPAAPVQQAPVSQPQAAQITPALPAPQQSEQAPQQAIQSLASLIALTATQDSPLNVPKLTAVADDIQLDTETQDNGAANVIQPVDSSTLGSVPLDADTGMGTVQRVRDAGQLDLAGNGATEPAVRTAPLDAVGQLPEQVAPATDQPAADVAQPVSQPATLVATEAGAGGAQPLQAASTPKALTGYIGQDGTSIDEGGTPFKSKLEAQKAKKLQPMMRVKQVAGGFVLADKTPAQLAAEEKAAKRIRGANAEAGSKGKPMAAHEFIASRGGMAPRERSDLGIEGNVKIGNRWLFAGKGKGMSIAQAAEALQEAGYIKEDSHNAAYDLIKRSVSNPQYTDEGWESVAELERQTQFEDYLAQQSEAEDALGPLDASDYTGDTGYEPASEELQAEVRALIEQLEAAGIDSELLMDEAVRENVNKSDEEYYDSAKQKLTNALTQNARSGSNEPDGGNAQGRQGQETVDGSRADSGQVDGQPSNAGPTSEAGQESPDQGLTSYTPQEIEDRLAKLEQAEQERKRLDREAEQNAKAEREAKDIADRQRASADNFQLGQSAEDSLSGQQDIFSAPAQEEAPAEPAPEATPAAPAKPARKHKESAAELRAKLEDHFAVGNIIKSDYWKTDSRVLSFDWNGGNWSVTVEGVGKRDGEWVSASSPRTHSTMFSAKDEVIERGNKPATQAETPTEAQDKIADFGQKIGGARKDVWTSFKDQLGEVVDDDIALQPLSKVWPQPDYQALLDGGTDPWTVAFIRAARDEIPAKPRQSYKVKRWAEQVKTLRSFANLIMGEKESETGTAKKFIEKSQTIKPLLGRVELYLEVGHGKSLDGMTMQENFYSLYTGEKNVTKWVIEQKTKSSSFGSWPRSVAAGNTKEEVVAKFKALYEGLASKDDAKKQVTFDIYSKYRVDGFFVGKKLGRNYIDLAGPFATVKEARTYKAESQAELVDKLEKVKEIPRERRDMNEPRVGEDMRNGQDVTPQMFGAAFGFRGVEFGNWVEQGRRQQDLNDAFDALMDMAAVLNIPAKAISLNGELGLAFGARGSGGVSPAAAHYERDKVVINLTKKNGAGSLGHEWWHALDNYFSRKRNKADGMMTDALDVKLASTGSKYLYQDKGVRKEMVDAYGVVMKAINSTAIKARSAQLDGKRSKDYWTTDVEMSARAFESYLIAKLQDQNASNDYLANIVDPETWDAMAALGMQLDESYPYPTAGEIPAIRAGFDEFFKTTESRETDKGVEIYSTSKGKPVNISERLTPSAIEEEIGYALAKFAHKPVIRVLDTAVGVLPGASDSDGISGALHDSSIYLFRDFLDSRTEVQRTFFHELLHYGLRRFLTRDQFISQMSKLYERDSYIKKEADAWVQTAVGQRTKATYGEAFAKARGVDEALAIFAEENRSGPQDKPVLERVRSVLTKWLAQLADFLGFKKYAADLRAVKNDEANALINEIFGKIEVDATPAVDTWNDMAEPAFATNSMQSVANTWTVPEPGAGDGFIRAIQNNKIDLKRVRDAIANQYGSLKQYADAYLNEELYHGKVAARVEALHKEHVEPILAKIAVAGKNASVTMDDVNLYLHARHAPERNAAMKAINPDMKDNEALSGLSNQEAAKVLVDFNTAGKGNALALIAKDVDQLLSDTRTGLVADGLEDAGVVAAWEAAYKHYVPLQRDIGSNGTPKGMGFSVRGPEAKRAVGSNKEVVNILANIVTQAETAVIRAEKTIVGRSLLAMARQYPNPEFWKVDMAPTKPRINKDTGLVERNAIDPLYQTADNVMMVKDYGQEHFIVFEKKNERAMAVAKAMKNLDIEPMNKILEVASKGTRFLASLLTQRNPLFWLTNFTRDVQGAMLNLEGTAAEGLQRQVMANLPKAFKGMHAVVRGEGVGQWARYAKEMQEAGGTTGYMQNFENSDLRMKDLEKEVARMQQGKADPRRLARMALEFVDDYNDIIENSVRLSVFQAAREGGASTQKAATIAKNITVNFNRKGNMTPSVNALFMFFNASVQGTARMMQALATSKTARIAVGGMAVMGFMMDMLNRMVAGDDDETKRNRYDLIPEFEKSHNWIFMNPMRPGEYVKVPLPLGPHVFHNAGRLLSDAINRKDPRNASEYGWSMASIFLDAFSPMGQAASVSQLIAPSVLDPIVQVAENKSFTGAPVYKSAERFGKTDPRPAYTRYFESTPDVWKGASRMLNDITGGDKVKPGMVNIEPDIMKHFFYTLTGGPGRTLDQTVDMTQAGARGKELTVNRVPLASRFYGANDDQQRERAYYDDRKRAGDAKTQFDYYIKQGRQDLAKEVATELGDGDVTKGRRMMMEFSQAEKSVRKINSEIRRQMEREDDDEAKAEQLKALRQRRVRVMSNALDDE